MTRKNSRVFMCFMNINRYGELVFRRGRCDQGGSGNDCFAGKEFSKSGRTSKADGEQSA